LRRRLKEEQSNTKKANLARLEAETRCHLAERERDVYQVLTRRLKARLNAQSREGLDDNVEEAAAAMMLDGSDNISLFGLFRRFHEMEQDLDDEEEDDSGDEDLLEQEDEDVMEDDSLESNHEMIDEEDVPPHVASSSVSKILRPQARTVSISEADI
jgi:hypothetical protein